MKPTLIFDLDGTLIDSLPGIAASLNHALLQHGLPGHDISAVRTFIGNGSRILVTRALPAPAADPLIDAVETAFKLHYDARWSAGTHVFPCIPELLSALHRHGHPLAVLSNKPDPFTRAIVTALFPGIPFAAVIGQRAGIPHKPDPAGALEISRLLETPPARCTLVGDSTIDIHTARAAGMKAIAVSWGYHDPAPLRAAAPDAWADTPADLLALLA